MPTDWSEVFGEEDWIGEGARGTRGTRSSCHRESSPATGAAGPAEAAAAPWAPGSSVSSDSDGASSSGVGGGWASPAPAASRQLPPSRQRSMTFGEVEGAMGTASKVAAQREATRRSLGGAKDVGQL